MFVGREAELDFLETKYHAKGRQLIAFYGRRHIGKTETLKRFCADKPHFFFSCRECSNNMQLRSFSKTLRQACASGPLDGASFDGSHHYFQNWTPDEGFTSWENALYGMLHLPFGTSRKLIILDEFPYIYKDNPRIISTLQKFWDTLHRDYNIMLVLCGSTMNFFEKKILRNSSPLFGRLTGVFKMDNLSFFDAVKFFPNYSDQDKIIAYAVFGGSPHHLLQIDPSLSLADNIKQNILSKGCALYNEVDFLLRQELRETLHYNTLLETIARGSGRISEISRDSLIDETSKTGAYLYNLLELEVVKREPTLVIGSELKGSAKRSLYRHTDYFFHFWYAFAYQNYAALEEGDVDKMYDTIVKPHLMEYASKIFPDICRQYLKELQGSHALPFQYAQLGQLFGKTVFKDGASSYSEQANLDILAMSEDKTNFLLGECRFSGNPVSYFEYLALQKKLIPLRKRANFYYALFSGFGFEEKLCKIAAQNHNLILYPLEQIVAKKAPDPTL